MMNKTEFTEYAGALLEEHLIELFDEKNEVGVYLSNQKNELANHIFNLKTSSIVIHKNDKLVGAINFVMSNTKAKGGAHIAIQNHSENDQITRLVNLKEKYQP